MIGKGHNMAEETPNTETDEDEDDQDEEHHPLAILEP